MSNRVQERGSWAECTGRACQGSLPGAGRSGAQGSMRGTRSPSRPRSPLFFSQRGSGFSPALPGAPCPPGRGTRDHDDAELPALDVVQQVPPQALQHGQRQRVPPPRVVQDDGAAKAVKHSGVTVSELRTRPRPGAPGAPAHRTPPACRRSVSGSAGGACPAPAAAALLKAAVRGLRRRHNRAAIAAGSGRSGPGRAGGARAGVGSAARAWPGPLVGKDRWDHRGQPMTKHRQTMALSVSSRLSLNSSRTVTPPPPRAALMSSHSVKKFFPMCNPSLSCHSLRLCSLMLSLVAWEGTPTPSWLQSPVREL